MEVERDTKLTCEECLDEDGPDKNIDSHTKGITSRKEGLRPKITVSFNHRYDHIMAIILTQMSVNKDLKLFGDRAANAPIELIYGKMTVTHSNMHENVGMDFECLRNKKVVQLCMKYHLEEALQDFTGNITGTVNTPVATHLFEVDDEC